MQLLEILSKLSASDLAEVEQRIHAQKRKTLSLLFKELKKLRTGKRELNREKIFEKIFGEKHTPDTDFKLRNETRLLKNQLFQFLVDHEVKREMRENEDFRNQWLLKAMARYDLREQFERHIDQAMQEARDKLNIEGALELMMVKRTYYSAMGYANPLSADDFMALLEEIQEYKIRNMVRLIRDIDGSRALVVKGKATQKGRIQYKDQALNLKLIEKISLKDHEDEFTFAARLKAEMYLQSGKQRIETTYKFLEVIHSLTERGLVSVQVEVQLLETLATYLIAEGQYENAWDTLEKHVSLAESNGLNVSVALHHTRLYCLVLWGKYQQAIDYYNSRLPEIEKNRYFHFAVHDICYANLFLNRTKEAISLMLTNFSDVKEEQMFDTEYKLRFGFIIAHLVDNDTESAGRELSNFKRSKTYTHDESGFYKSVASLFESYLRVKHEPGSKKYMGLVKKVNEFSGRLKSPVLQVVWLQRQLSQPK